MEPKTLEEALAVIKQRDVSITDLTKSRDDFKKKAETVLDEKKDLLKLFDDKDKEGMTETEKKMAEALEKESGERKKLEDQIAADAKKRNDDENSRVSKALEERIVKASKGDTAVADKLRANVALLEKMPRGNDSEIDAILTTGWNMLGSKDANPLAETHVAGGAAPVDAKTNYADTDAGKGLADKLGLSVKPAEEAAK